MTQQAKISLPRYFAAWLVHLLTASGTVVGMLTLFFIANHQYVNAFWMMAITIVIDGIDGTLARRVGVKTVLPSIDGALLDNIVDYLNYVITPCFFLLSYPGMLPTGINWLVIIAISLCSAYQFCQSDAKTPDHFFKGFPCYWNIVIFYMFIFHSSGEVNASILAILCVFIFIPIKYVYPSRLDYLTDSLRLKVFMHLASIAYGISSALLLYNYPDINKVYLSISLGYIVLYCYLSIYRTLKPLSY